MKKGFTLVEELLVIIIVGIISLVFAVYIREGFDAWRFLSGQKTLSLSTRAALHRVTREIKRARQNVNITTHATSEMTFLDMDGNTVTFSQSGSNLLRNSDVLLENLLVPGGLAFSYLDRYGNPTHIPIQIRAVRCRLVTVSGDNRFVLESSARIRVRRLL